MTTRQTDTNEAAGISRLLKEIADSLGVLIGDHIKLARIELATDVRIYAGALGVSLVAALLLVIGYLFAWEAVGVLVARRWGAPIAFGLVATFHLAAAALSLGAVSRKLQQTKAMRETVTEARRSVRLLTHAIEGRAP